MTSKEGCATEATGADILMETAVVGAVDAAAAAAVGVVAVTLAVTQAFLGIPRKGTPAILLLATLDILPQVTPAILQRATLDFLLKAAMVDLAVLPTCHPVGQWPSTQRVAVPTIATPQHVRLLGHHHQLLHLQEEVGHHPQVTYQLAGKRPRIPLVAIPTTSIEPRIGRSGQRHSESGELVLLAF